MRICHRDSIGSGRAHCNGIESYWGFAKRRLQMYHGDFKRNFPLFMREMEFRFNQRNAPEIVEYLFMLLKSGPVLRSDPLHHMKHIRMTVYFACIHFLKPMDNTTRLIFALGRVVIKYRYAVAILNQLFNYLQPETPWSSDTQGIAPAA